MAAMRAMYSAWTVAGSSHQNASGDAAWMLPITSPHITGRRQRAARGLCVCVWFVIVESFGLVSAVVGRIGLDRAGRQPARRPRRRARLADTSVAPDHEDRR